VGSGDAELPGAVEVFYYEVDAENACAEWPFGTAARVGRRPSLTVRSVRCTP